MRYLYQIRCVGSRCQMFRVRLVGHVDESDRGVSDSCARWLFHIGVSDRFVKIVV